MLWWDRCVVSLLARVLECEVDKAGADADAAVKGTVAAPVEAL